jgi:hypothetical protein
MEVGAVWTKQHVFPRLLHLFNSLPPHTDTTYSHAPRPH